MEITENMYKHLLSYWSEFSFQSSSSTFLSEFWTTEEIKALQVHFKNQLEQKSTVRKTDVEMALRKDLKNDKVLQDRTLPQIRTKLNHMMFRESNQSFHSKK